MELVPKSSLLDCKTDQTKLEELAANVTEHGFSKATLQYLRVHLNNSCSLRSFFLPVSQAKYKTSYFRIGLVSCFNFHVDIFTSSYILIDNKCFPDLVI